MTSAPKHWEQDKEATVYVGNLDERATDSLVWELMLQAGRIVNVHLPKDRVSQTHQGYGFVEFISEEDADYAARIMNGIRLYGKPIRVNKASADKTKTVEVGAELFVGNLDAFVDEKTLYDTFGKFGNLIVAPKIARDDSNLSKGYGFISFADFEASDAAIMHMHGRYLANKEITVQYAYKKDGKGERHGDEAERTLAAQARKHNVQPAIQPLPPQLFGAPPTPGGGTGANGFPQGGYGGSGPPNGGYGGPPQGYHNQPPPGYHNQPPPGQAPPQPMSATPLPPPGSGLPQRPPPSQGGYGGPPPPSMGFPPPPMGMPPGGFPGQGPPPGMGMPPGMPPPPQGPPPPFMQQQQGVYGRR